MNVPVNGRTPLGEDLVILDMFIGTGCSCSLVKRLYKQMLDAVFHLIFYSSSLGGFSFTSIGFLAPFNRKGLLNF